MSPGRLWWLIDRSTHGQATIAQLYALVAGERAQIRSAMHLPTGQRLTLSNTNNDFRNWVARAIINYLFVKNRCALRVFIEGSLMNEPPTCHFFPRDSQRHSRQKTALHVLKFYENEQRLYAEMVPEPAILTIIRTSSLNSLISNAFISSLPLTAAFSDDA